MGRRGFSLLELLVVIGILTILIAIAIPLYFETINQAKRNAHLSNMRLVKEALEMYYLKNKQYPIDAWSFTNYVLYNPQYFPEPLICPYNNQPYKAIQWQPYYTNWDDIWDWIESSNNYHQIYYKSENPTYSYAFTYYSR
ncbi:MAG: type II secretion system protein [Dictyoglomus turgidum]|uniref:type II secretion system protein n=1 Tax=Dictyoglomus turgidum TaxID=513050 RepID=UPI003C78E9C2